MDYAMASGNSAEHSSCLRCRITSDSLDPEKNWYVVTKELCGTRPTDFTKSEVFKHFPSEIKNVSARELRVQSGTWPFTKVSSQNIYVVSTFGLCAGLSRQRELPENGLVRSDSFLKLIHSTNHLNFDLEDVSSFGGKCEFVLKTPDKDHSTNLSTETPTSLNNSPSSSSSPSSDSGYPSSESLADDKYTESVIKSTKASPLGPTIKRRKIGSHCQKVLDELQDVSAKYHESLSCILGNSFSYGSETEKEIVSTTISEVLEIVMEQRAQKRDSLKCLTMTPTINF